MRFWYYYYITISNFFNFKISYSFEIFFVYSRMKLNHFQSAFSPLGRIVNIRAILTAKYRHVTDLTEVVCSVVKLENSVSKVIICCCWKYVYSVNMHLKAVLFFSLTNICTNNTFVIDNDLLIISLFPQVCLKVTQLNNRPYLRHFGLLAFLYYLALPLFSFLLLFGSGKMYSKHVIFWLVKYSSDTKLICCF